VRDLRKKTKDRSANTNGRSSPKFGWTHTEVYRASYPAGFAEAARHTKIVIGTANTAILLTSSFFVAWAVTVARLRESRFAALLLCAAAVLPENHIRA
jgi:heme/copper-type cytochrome/quinol oxidase subunit 3